MAPAWWNRLRTTFYRLKYHGLGRARFGPGVTVTCKLEIKGPGKVFIGRGTVIGADPWGEDFVTLFTHDRDARIRIGENVRLRGTRVGCQSSITIEDRAIVDSASIFDTDFHAVAAGERDERASTKVDDVTIGVEAYVGPEVICGKGTRLHAGSRLIAGSVISTKQVPPGVVLAGNPARPASD